MEPYKRVHCKKWALLIVLFCWTHSNELIQKAAHGPKTNKTRYLKPITIPSREDSSTVTKTGVAKLLRTHKTNDTLLTIINEILITVPIILGDKVTELLTRNTRKNFFTEKHLRILYCFFYCRQ